jgi:hypothetical protein
VTHANQESAKDLAAELLALAPPDRFEVVAALLREKRPEMVALGWKIAERTVKEFAALDALRMGREASAERGLARMRGHLAGGGS